MNLLREVSNREALVKETGSGPATPEGGWNVGHLANHGILLSCDGFSLKLDVDQLNVLFDLAEDASIGEIKDHAGKTVSVEVLDDGIILSRVGDKTYPAGVLLDLDTLKEIGIERPEDDDESAEEDDTVEADEDGLKEGVKRAFRRAGKKIKRGFRVTSGFRKGRVVANIKNAFKPRAKARTRMKLKIASRKKKLIRILKSKRTRRKPLSKRLKRLNSK